PAMADNGGWGGLGGVGRSEIGSRGMSWGGMIFATGIGPLSSPSDAPFSTLPQTLGMVGKSGEKRRSEGALYQALKDAGLDDAAARAGAANPEAAKIMLGTQHQRQQAGQSKQWLSGLAGLYGGDVPAAAPSSNVGGMGGIGGAPGTAPGAAGAASGLTGAAAILGPKLVR